MASSVIQETVFNWGFRFFQLNFVGVTVEPNRRYLHFPGTKHVFTPVPIGEMTPPKQVRYQAFTMCSLIFMLWIVLPIFVIDCKLKTYFVFLMNFKIPEFEQSFMSCKFNFWSWCHNSSIEKYYSIFIMW